MRARAARVQRRQFPLSERHRKGDRSFRQLAKGPSPAQTTLQRAPVAPACEVAGASRLTLPLVGPERDRLSNGCGVRAATPSPARA